MNTILTNMHKTRLHIIRIFALLLLLMVVGTANEAWAVKVTYHILTLPFDVKNKDNSTYKWTDVRVEALLCTSTEANIGLPEEFKSPLAQNFKYYRGVTCSHINTKLYDHDGNNNNKVQPLSVTYDIFEETDLTSATLLDLSSPVAAIDGENIYVTYEYVGNNPGNILLLDGSQNYNIQLTNNRFLCLNRSRNNRPGAANAAALTAEHLASEDFVVPKAGTSADAIGFNWSTASDAGLPGICLRFKFVGEDPYNVTIMTAYEGTATYTEKLAVEGTRYKKTYAGSSLFARLKSDGTSEKGWMSPDADRHYKNTSDETDYDSWQGFYRGDMNPIFNSVAVLPKGTNDYLLVASKMNQNGKQYQPNSSGKYAFFSGSNANDPVLVFQDIDKIPATVVYEINQFTFKVNTPLSVDPLTLTIDWSEDMKSEKILDHIPAALQRKYVKIEGAYKEKEFVNLLTTFEDAETNDNIIWLKYTSSMPFDALPLGGSYEDARWYTMRLNADVNEYKYIAYDNGSSSLITTDGSGDAKGDDSNMHTGENSAEVQVAFMGDPFELKILSRKASETATGNRYIGCATEAAANATLSTNKTGSSDISTWEIAPDNVTGSIVLRKYGSHASPMYIDLGSAANNKPVTYSSTASRIKVVELEKKKYMYHIVRSDGTVAVMASTMQDVGQPLNNYTHIPEAICTPFFNPALGYSPSLSFYYTKENATTPTSPQINAPYVGDGATEGIYAHVYVRYSFGSALPSYTYNVRLNGQYIYYNSSSSDASKIDYAAAPVDADEYKWPLVFSDPYAMTINNTKAGQYVSVDSWTNGAVLKWGATASKFIVKSSYTLGVYEVMAATGEDVDASVTYYNIGRNGSQVRMYDNNTYEHTYAQLRFLLTSVGSSAVDYHLYDKSGSELLVVRSHSDQLVFPSDYYSPLVDTYRFWTTSARNVAVSNLNDVTPVEGVKHVYVDYTTNNLVNLKKGELYLLKFNTGDEFRQEDGHDDLTEEPVRAVYPYCNGDCNFFVYGQDEYELQQQGAASTRTRWVWYLESANNDPYHVKISSRQQQEYPTGSDNNYNAYFRTFAVNYNQDAVGAAPHIITTLAWPGITGEQGTEYMVLGSAGMYQLLTTETIPIDLNGDSDYEDTNENERHVVKSFEQYWKTYDTVKNKLLKDILADKDKGASPTGSTLVPEDPSSYRTLLTGTGPGQYGFHSYPHWAYAKRFNGYNADGETKKGWEEIEHWYQTVNMGEGYFDFVKTTVDPALILLDQHGWEIMRKALPSGPDEDPETKAAKYAAIRPYNSPMVKEYYFWTSSKKMTGYHQYYNLGGQITVDGEPYTSTSLTDLPPYATAKNVLDTKGNLNDQYVTYVVKDEYAHSYNPSNKVGAKFLIQQGNSYVSTADGSTLTMNPATGGMAAVIVAANGSFSDDYLWYVKPNPNIDNEMGYGVTGNASSTHSGWNVDYTDDSKLTGYPSNGFDPYNIQISSAAYPAKFFVTDATEALLDDGIVTANGTTISLGTGADPTYSATKYYDGSKLAITNKTFMAVADAEGSIQLMPRFDQGKRVRNFSTLETPVGEAGKLNEMKTSLYLPTVYEYHIIDNLGNESLRYKSGGDLAPQTPEHFKSPLAKDFKYYTTLTAGVASDEITASFASATLTNGNVYVRYQYNWDDDNLHMLDGKWLTMQLNAKDAIYDSGIKQASGDKPATIDDTKKTWQWKFLETPQSTPDPYAVYLFNRSQSAGTKAIANKFAILSHTSGGYALAKAGRNDYTYQFLNGANMSESTAAVVAEDKDGDNPSGFTSTSGVFHGTDSQVSLSDEVEHTFTYKIYTNDGVFAISEEQDNATIKENDYVPVLPENIKSPLLKKDYFRYYNKDNFTFDGINIATADTTDKALNNLYGLYDDIVCVRYLPYNPDDSEYKVPNAMNNDAGVVAVDVSSNDASLGLDGNLLYNIVWYNDKMMKSNNAAIEYTACGSLNPAWTLTANSDYEWKLVGSDPYAIKIVNMANKNVYTSDDATCSLSDNATTFMFLNSEGYDYGVLAKTGDKSKMLSGNGNSIATSSPTKFIFFALATHKVIYHLIIAKSCKNHASPNAGEFVDIPYYDTSLETPALTTKRIYGTTQRDLTTTTTVTGDTYQLGTTMSLGSPAASVTYCYDAGHISLGDKLAVPAVFYRPNVNFDFVVEGVYDDDACATPTNSEENNMYDKYRGHQRETMGEDAGLLGKTVLINIVYSFDGNLDTNVGDGFVVDVANNQWYTFETSDETPWLAHFTYKDAKLTALEGRTTHYTNDYLWSPLGDPYGFKMYNRYVYKNGRETTTVMTTDNIAADEEIKMGATALNEERDIYELLALENTTPGHFLVHPMKNNTGTQYYLKNTSGTLTLSTTPTEWIYGLSEQLLNPYYQAAGYVGGLNDTGKTAYETAQTTYSANPARLLRELQKIVYDDDNIVAYAPGYYRLHSVPGASGVGSARYVSGYTHKTELTPGTGTDLSPVAIPLHFYEQENTSTKFELLSSGGSLDAGYTKTNANQGEIPISPVEYDPSSIFYFYEGSAGSPASKIATQGLYVKENKMTATPGDATTFYILDIGGGVVVLHNNGDFGSRTYLGYNTAGNIYDLNYAISGISGNTRWCMQPANKLGLKVATHSGGDAETYGGISYNYTSLYVPFDVMLPDTAYSDNEKTKISKIYHAVVLESACSPWDASSTKFDLHPKSIGRYNIAANGCPSKLREDESEIFRTNNRFVPAGTPVLIAMLDNSGYIQLSLPNSSPNPMSSPFVSSMDETGSSGSIPKSTTRTNILSGQYLEQKLALGSTDRIYVFGLPYSGTMTLDPSDGQITATLPLQDNSGMGFYLNANPNKEAGLTKSSWTRNNWYVYNNKVYYHATGVSSAREFGDLQFVPVLFGDFDGEEEEGSIEEGLTPRMQGDNHVYDLSGRCVATPEQVADGSWWQNLSHGIYILNGKKIRK